MRSLTFRYPSSWKEEEVIIGRDGIFDLYYDTHHESIGVRWGETNDDFYEGTNDDFHEGDREIPVGAPTGTREAFKKAKTIALLLGLKE